MAFFQPDCPMFRASLTLTLICTAFCAVANPMCTEKTTSIHDIQGPALESPMTGKTVLVKGVVTANFTGQQQLGGFFIQANDQPTVNGQSGGLFIRHQQRLDDLQAGDLVVISGDVSEQFEVTQINPIRRLLTCARGQALPEAVELQLPVSKDHLEAHEGMRIKLASPHVITDLYQYIKYGEMTVSSQLLLSPSARFRPGESLNQYRNSLSQDQLVIDDGRLAAYARPLAAGLDGQPIQASTAPHLGQTVVASGVLHFGFGRYKLQPTSPMEWGDSDNSSRSTPPMVPGALKVASFNLENLFTTLDAGQDACGPQQNFSCRGADNALELERQMDKLVLAINGANAAVMGLQELENNAKASISALVTALNEAAGLKRWHFIDTGILGDDVIKVGIIYQPALLTPEGPHAILNSAANPAFKERQHRLVVAQTFKDANQNRFNLATVHFKSKSCSDAEGENQDQNDGQGCFNAARQEVSHLVADWLDSDPTGQGAAATFLVGDFNAYAFEDPMVTLADKGYKNMAASFLGSHNWTASFRGMVGALDHILANQAAQKLVKGVAQWHINSTAVYQFDYNTELLDEDFPRPEGFYYLDPFASSDHDLVMAGFEFKE